MAKKQKFYAVWHGHPPGLYNSWDACQKAIKGISGAQYKSYASRAEAQRALDGPYKAAVEAGKKQNPRSQGKSELSSAERARIGAPNLYSIAVDAASSGNPGRMEYRGVDPQTGKVLFHQGPFERGTNNIGEFLALVHGLAHLKKEGSDRIIYTDSRIAMGWVRKKKCGTKLAPHSSNKILFELIARAESWLKDNTYKTPVVKWETKAWGEIPADFGRK
ncbi:ribonuclease H family protein [Flavobacteriaceae bacterium]|nr:ribonuclease H family protein [Flavobacteriaceae bacterium]